VYTDITPVNMDEHKGEQVKEKPTFEVEDPVVVGEVLNASGHKQELQRQFSLLSVCAIGINTGNVWAALGGSIVRFALSLTTHFCSRH
jgi:choline transport protein